MWLLALLIIVNIYLLTQTGKPRVSSNGEKKWTIYGTMGCGWTRKQLDYMKKNGKPHEFVDCDKDGCEGVDAFPTLVSPDGEKTVGYKEV
jgi:hypothetical protein